MPAKEPIIAALARLLAVARTKEAAGAARASQLEDALASLDRALAIIDELPEPNQPLVFGPPQRTGAVEI